MLSWRTNMEAETTVDGFSNVSTAEMLRGIVAEKLTAAALEILAVFERTVAGYEEEASGLRQEIDRQRRQLEVLLQPEIKLETIDDQFPVCGPAVGGAAAHPEEEVPHKHELNNSSEKTLNGSSGVEDSGGLGLLRYPEFQMEANEQKEAQERLAEPDDGAAARRSAGRLQVSDDHIDLRIRILDDSQINVLSVNTFQKYPVHDVRCPRSLQEADFLDLLRSTFPQLAALTPFDLLISDRLKRLQPLNIQTLTPEEIYWSITPRRSVLYIRPQTQESTNEDLPPSQRNDAAADSPSTSPRISFLSPRVQSGRRNTGGTQISELKNHIGLRICLLGDSRITVLSQNVYREYPVQELQCPRGLQEAHFLDLLRSAFPQLAAQKHFDVLITDKTKKLKPLNVRTLTPEKISMTIGHSALYIRLKAPEEVEVREEATVQRNDAADSPSTSPRISFLLPRVKSGRRNTGGTQISELKNHIGLRICLLGDSRITVLSQNVYREYPVQELQCPRGLQEAHFLDLLRSAFPQLAAQKHFDVLITDKTKKLKPLNVRTLTPEKISMTIGHSALYIRLKAPEEVEVREEATVQRNDAADSPSRLSSRVQSDRKTSGGFQKSEPQNLIDLRICILEDYRIKALQPTVYREYPVKELQCPRGLQEADFLDLLRSTFPQLAARKPFDVLITDKTKKLKPLNVRTLTPEKISKTTRHSALYIRLKAPEEVEVREEATVQRNDAADSPSRLSSRVQSDRKKSGGFQKSEPQNLIDLRICILEDYRINVLSTAVYREYPVQELQCPRGLQEAHFLDLLRSAFPQLAAQKHFDVFTSDRSKKLKPLMLKTLTPEQISAATGFSALYIRLKAQEEVQSSEEELHDADAVEDSSSTSDQTRLNSSRSQHEDMETEEADDEDGGRSKLTINRFWSLLALSESDGEKSEANDDDWKPDESEKQPSEGEPETTPTRRRRFEGSEVNTKRRRPSHGNGDSPLSCKVCPVLRASTNMLIKHAWSHVDDPERLCGVCGEHSESSEELRSHLHRHQKTHSCNICGKSFLSTNGLAGHVARHKGKKPYTCKICHKGFAQTWVLKNHMWVHAPEKPNKCDLCPKAFSSKVDLKRHRMSHTGKTLHRCDVCGKSLSSLKILSQHMLRHWGDAEPTFACELCSKTFDTNRKLQAHMRVHTEEKPHKCSATRPSVRTTM